MDKTNAVTEEDIKAAGAAVAPRVTPADIEAAIASEHYFTARDARDAGVEADPDNEQWYGLLDSAAIFRSLECLTICVLVLRNGFTVLGKSACASPENFNAEIGRRVAREDAINQCWSLLGYALRDRLRQAEPPAA